jgi:CsoR family transcriptional regulator, copper-sensing transcriptional repressor
VADSELVGGRIILRRTEDERKPILERLSRIEGQVRGIRVMIEQERYCLDEVQQISAARAALREVALIIIGQHVEQGIRHALEKDEREQSLADVMRVLREAMRAGD